MCRRGRWERGVDSVSERKRPSEVLSVRTGEVALLPFGIGSSEEANRQVSGQQAEGKEVQQKWATWL